MAEEPQNYPSTPQQASSVPPQPYPPQNYGQQQPLNYPQQNPQQPYAPQQGIPMQYPQGPQMQAPAQAVPVRKNKGGSGALVWLLGGCGVFALIFIIGFVWFAMSIGNDLSKSDLVKNSQAVPTAKQHLMEIRTALQQYTTEHGGKYPASLDQIVDKSLLSYAAGGSGETVPIEYTPPVPNAPEDIAVAGYYVGQLSMKFGPGINQKVYLKLLKNGTIVQEQIQRIPMMN